MMESRCIRHILQLLSPHGWSDYYEDPMEDVDAVIAMMETTMKEAANAPDPT